MVTRKQNGQWKPGESGNPHGRPPKDQTLAELLRAAGTEEITRGGVKATRNVHLVALIWKTALAGDEAYVRLLLDRLLGRAAPADADESPAPILLLPAGGPWGGVATVRTAPAKTLESPK